MIARHGAAYAMIEFVVTHVGLDALTPEQIDEGVRRLADTVSEVRG